MADEFDYVYKKLISGEKIELCHIDVWEDGVHRAVFKDDPEYEKLNSKFKPLEPKKGNRKRRLKIILKAERQFNLKHAGGRKNESR